MANQAGQRRPDRKDRSKNGAIASGTALAAFVALGAVAWQFEFFGLADDEPEWEIVYTDKPLTLGATGPMTGDSEMQCWWESIELDDPAGEIALEPSIEGDPSSDDETDLAWWNCYDGSLEAVQVGLLAGKESEGVWVQGTGLFSHQDCTKKLDEAEDERVLEADVSKLEEDGVKIGSAACVRTTDGALARLILTGIAAGDDEGEQQFSFDVTLWGRTD
ncbi:hypothetical protein [Glycomyces paridis]|uniref:Uncharacterized protein n=1 Tax=Glycomyces paridis TaxID=2126555 RepID=A0A4S8PB75_9ACTN|nr:hypothetical protein [Glycomyces paridis]THV26775.1 hypothetical protein E9998_17475 [Glycomyces paridis]